MGTLVILYLLKYYSGSKSILKTMAENHAIPPKAKRCITEFYFVDGTIRITLRRKHALKENNENNKKKYCACQL